MDKSGAHDTRVISVSSVVTLRAGTHISSKQHERLDSLSTQIMFTRSILIPLSDDAEHARSPLPPYPCMQATSLRWARYAILIPKATYMKRDRDSLFALKCEPTTGKKDKISPDAYDQNSPERKIAQRLQSSSNLELRLSTPDQTIISRAMARGQNISLPLRCPASLYSTTSTAEWWPGP